MSYDIRVWCASEPDLRAVAPDPRKWFREGNLDVFSGPGWQVAYTASAVEPEDVPSAVASSLPGISWLVEFNLSPISAKSGEAFLKKAVRALSRVAHGVVEDPQAETLTLPTGVKRFAPPERSELIDVIEISWWTNTNSLRDPDALDRLVDALKETLPESMPKRYGDHEPPQYRIAEHGESHFREFFKKSVGGILAPVIYATRPVVDVSISSGYAPGPCFNGYRANRFSIEVEASALSQPGWQRQLKCFWERVSCTLNPFYGDVRRLAGHELSRGVLWSGPQTEEHPIVSWWFNGLPETSGLAIVLGEPYNKMWSLGGSALEREGLLFASVADWSGDERLAAVTGQPPKEMAQPRGPHFPIGLRGWSREEAYPLHFPFEIQAGN